MQRKNHWNLIRFDGESKENVSTIIKDLKCSHKLLQSPTLRLYEELRVIDDINSAILELICDWEQKNKAPFQCVLQWILKKVPRGENEFLERITHSDFQKCWSNDGDDV